MPHNSRRTQPAPCPGTHECRDDICVQPCVSRTICFEPITIRALLSIDSLTLSDALHDRPVDLRERDRFPFHLSQESFAMMPSQSQADTVARAYAAFLATP